MKVLLLLIVIWMVSSDIPHYTRDQINNKIGETRVMYGDTVRIKGQHFTYQYSNSNLAYIHI